ncbi:hypothetical protein LOD99_9901 [Oopsacas minuta]|uniref:Uncharacterized protein n=1 Tax=Oopsacas minuta TaxID=111878 RepID=A0AAV7KR17_9METZ|nr:hypothetical protein LOD99_9901 [Oopsacas minuta]
MQFPTITQLYSFNAHFEVEIWGINQRNGLLLLYGFTQPNHQQMFAHHGVFGQPLPANKVYSIKIFTVDGYHVTSLATKQINSVKCAKFTEYLILFRNGLDELVLFNDFHFEIKHRNKIIDLIDCDEDGNIYTNCEEKDSISFYTQDLEIKRKITFNNFGKGKPNSLAMNNEIMVILTSRKNAPLIENLYQIHMYSLSTLEHIETVTLIANWHYEDSEMYIDKQNNIIIINKSGITLYFDKGEFRHYQIEKDQEGKCVFLVRDSQIIRIMEGGELRIYNFSNNT